MGVASSHLCALRVTGRVFQVASLGVGVAENSSSAGTGVSGRGLVDGAEPQHEPGAGSSGQVGMIYVPYSAGQYPSGAVSACARHTLRSPALSTGIWGSKDSSKIRTIP